MYVFVTTWGSIRVIDLKELAAHSDALGREPPDISACDVSSHIGLVAAGASLGTLQSMQTTQHQQSLLAERDFQHETSAQPSFASKPMEICVKLRPSSRKASQRSDGASAADAEEPACEQF